MLDLRVFGGLVLASGKRRLLDGRRKPLALLAILAVHGERGVSRDRLAAYLWPESTPERARGVLKQTLYALRQELGIEDLIVGATDLRLNAEQITSDLARMLGAFAAGELEAAADCYTGPFLDGFYLEDQGEELERWIEGVRSEAAAEHRRTLRRLAEAAEDAGQVESATRWWRRLSAEDPLNPAVTLGLMRCALAAGDLAGASAAATEHQARRARDLGVGPDPAVAALAVTLFGTASAGAGDGEVALPSWPAAPHPASPGPVLARDEAAQPVAPSEAPGRSDSAPKRLLGGRLLLVLGGLLLLVPLLLRGRAAAGPGDAGTTREPRRAPRFISEHLDGSPDRPLLDQSAHCPDTTDAWWWRQRWQIDTNATQIDPRSIPHGWVPDIEAVASTGNAPRPGASGGVLVLHPGTLSQPAVVTMREEVELGPRQRLYIRAIGSIYGDGVLAVAFGEHPLPESYVLDGSAWRLVSFDLGQYSGDRGRFRLIAAAGGTMPWVYETLYLDEVCVE